MSKKSILLLLVITAIIIVATMSIFYKSPAIDSIDVTSELEQAFKESAGPGKIFDKDSQDIYLSIKTVSLHRGDEIRALFHTDDGVLYQENKIILENNGSAILTIPLLKKNDQLQAGSYSVEVFLNSKKSKTTRFSID